MAVLVGGTAVVVGAWRASRLVGDLQRLDFSALRTSAGRQRIRRLFMSGGTVGFAFGFLLFFAFALTDEDLGQGLMQRLAMGVAAGTALGTAFGFILGFAGGLTGALATHPLAIDRPARLVRQGLAHLTAVIMTVGLVFGFGFGLIEWLINGRMNVLVFGIGSALWIGLPVGFAFVANSPWPRYLVATRILAHRGDLPRRPAVFLDWAYESGLMRLSGVAVQFRHREFQDWLTTRGQPADDRAAAVVNTGLAATDGEQGIARTSAM